MTEVTPSSYWIASNALYITLNANGDPDYIVGNATSGAQILVYMKGINGLEYDAGHNYRRWPLSLSPTYFGTRTAKYVYVAVPRPGNPVGIATVVFPSEHIDIYGKNEQEEQIGSEDFYYIFLQGIISATNAGSTEPRTWQQAVETGTLSSDEALNAGGDNTWWKISTVDDTVHFLKEIVMDAKSFFQNFRLNGHEFVSEAKPGITPLDSENTIVTPLFGNRHYISKDHDDETQGEIGFLKGLWIKAKNLFGIGESGDASFRNLHLAENADIDGVLRSWAGVFANLLQSSNWTGDGHFDTGFRLMKDAAGVTSMVVDNLFVRMKAIFTELEIRKISYAGGNIIFSHAGGKIVALAGVTYIRGEAHVIGHTIYLDDAEVVGHKVILPDGAGEFAYRCYMLADDGTTRTQNWWQVDDQARCQTFNIQAGTYQNVSNSFYWRRVVGTGTEVLSDGKTYDYVDLSATDCFTGTSIDGIDVTGFESVPQTGDQLVQMGNRTDTSRQGFVTIEVRGENAPAFKVYKNVSGYSLDNKRKICLSPSLTDLKVNKLSIETEYEVARVPMQRADEWYTGMRCYYYDLVQHSGASWLCIYPEGGVDGVAYTTEEPSATATYWRAYAEKGERGATGPTGPTGPSAVGVTFNPESLIIEQNNEAPYNLKLENALVTLKIKEGDEDHSSGALITSVTPSTFEYQGATYNSCTCQTVLDTAVRITAVGTKGTTTVNGKTINNYVDQGYIDITVRYKGQNHTVRVYFYCNLLGTWQETVIGSTKTEVARSLSYAYTEEDPQDVKTLEQLGTFIKGSQDYEVNLQSKVLDANGNVVKTSGSLYKQTADAAELSITNKLGETGIKIDGNNREINLIAGKVNFKNADGATTNPKIAIDPATGTLHAVDGVFSGTVEAAKGRIGGFDISEGQQTSPNKALVLDGAKGEVRLQQNDGDNEQEVTNLNAHIYENFDDILGSGDGTVTVTNPTHTEEVQDATGGIDIEHGWQIGELTTTLRTRVAIKFGAQCLADSVVGWESVSIFEIQYERYADSTKADLIEEGVMMQMIAMNNRGVGTAQSSAIKILEEDSFYVFKARLGLHCEANPQRTSPTGTPYLYATYDIDEITYTQDFYRAELFGNGLVYGTSNTNYFGVMQRNNGVLVESSVPSFEDGSKVHGFHFSPLGFMVIRQGVSGMVFPTIWVGVLTWQAGTLSLTNLFSWDKTALTAQGADGLTEHGLTFYERVTIGIPVAWQALNINGATCIFNIQNRNGDDTIISTNNYSDNAYITNRPTLTTGSNFFELYDSSIRRFWQSSWSGESAWRNAVKHDLLIEIRFIGNHSFRPS